MIIIEKIEIKSFRSFGNRKIGKVSIEKLNHLNIFSGSNDSGKSNILRALNLFFNKHTDLNCFFNFNIDFFKKEKYDENDVKEEVVTIKLYLHNAVNHEKNKKNKSKIYLPEHFWVSRKFFKTSEYSTYAQDDGLVTAFKQEKGKDYLLFFDKNEKGKEIIKSTVKASLKKQLTQFIDSIQFHYIPAIKDKTYFSHLYGELQQTLWKEKKSLVIETKETFEKSIQSVTEKLMSDFQRITDEKENFSAAFELPENLIDIFKSLDVSTGSVKLSVRGDGIQAKLIPEILNFIAKKEISFKSRSLRKGEKSKKYFIWGFEEPENSYEYKNAQMLAEKFKNEFSKDVQILLTTHSFNYIALKGENISTFRVYKDISSTNVCLVKKSSNGEFDFDSSSNISSLHNELGVFQLNEELEKLYTDMQKQRQILYRTISSVELKLQDYTQPLIITEGKTDWKHFKRALEYFQGIGWFNDLHVHFLEYEDTDLQMSESQLEKLLIELSKIPRQNKVIGIFDCDTTTGKKYEKEEKQKLSKHVFAVSIPTPEFRKYHNGICTEFLYEDQDLKKVDNNGRRVYLSEEFSDKGRLKANKKIGLENANKIKNHTEKKNSIIIDSGVLDIDEKSLALSKDMFSKNVLNKVAPFDVMNFSGFKPLFLMIQKIIND